jgi:flagellar biosynthesis protein FlhB
MTDKHSKTELPTPKRLKDARKKGQVAKSNELSPAVALVVFSLAAIFMGRLLFHNSLLFMRRGLTFRLTEELTVTGAREVMGERIADFFIILWPYMLLATVIGVTVNLAQVGFLLTVHPIKPDIKKLNPIEGFKNIFSKKAIFTFVKNLMKLLVVFFLTYRTLALSAPRILNAGTIGTEKLFFFLLDLARELTLIIGFVMLAIAATDYVFQRREHRNKLKMSKQEIKDEYKEMEGNPQVKSARQQKQREISMSRMMSSLPEADVLITNPTHLAVAIRYDSEKDDAPVVLAKGADYLAAKLREVAKKHNITTIENKLLARSIYEKSEVGQAIPIELYQGVAEILAMVYRLKELNKGKI